MAQVTERPFGRWQTFVRSRCRHLEEDEGGTHHSPRMRSISGPRVFTVGTRRVLRACGELTAPLESARPISKRTRSPLRLPPAGGPAIPSHVRCEK
jgi:hypothetical protein